jgi:DNA modification methylase
MPEVEMAKLRRSIETFGLVEPIVVRKADGMIIGGHQRVEVARALGHTEVPVVYLDISKKEAKALNIALNRIQGEWDLPKLAELLEELQDLPDLDETLTGFDQRDIDVLLADLERQQLPPPYEESYGDALEALQAHRQSAPTRVKRGDIWRLDRHRLLCGDSLEPGALEQLCNGQKVDMLLTDPPYGIEYASSMARPGRRKQPIANDTTKDHAAFLERALATVKTVMKRGAVLYWFAGGGGPSAALAHTVLAVERHFGLLNILVWDKLDPGLGWRWRYSWEAIIEACLGEPRVWHGGSDKRNVLRFPKGIPGAEEHPTPKPVPLLEELMRAAAPSRGIILDPFAGSGPTLIAAERTGRTCLAVELEPRYCDIILARWEALTGQRAELEVNYEQDKTG